MIKNAISNKERMYTYKRKLMDYLEKGSFTVEMTVVMSLIFLVILSSLYLCFYVHNRSWLTAAAYETALTGSMETMKDHGKVYDVTIEKGKALGNVGFFGAENLSLEVNTDKNISVAYNLDIIENFYGLEWHLCTNGNSKVINPVKRIRQIKAAAEIIDTITGE